MEYALELDPMNLRFFKDFQKTLDFQKLAVRQNINTIVYCRSTEEQYNIQTQSNTTNEDEILTYKNMRYTIMLLNYMEMIYINILTIRKDIHMKR